MFVFDLILHKSFCISLYSVVIPLQCVMTWSEMDFSSLVPPMRVSRKFRNTVYYYYSGILVWHDQNWGWGFFIWVEFFFFFRALFRMVLMRFFETWFGLSCASFGPKTSSSRHTHVYSFGYLGPSWCPHTQDILVEKKNWILWNILIEIWAWNAASCVWYAGKISKFLLSAARLQLLTGVIWYQSVSL